MSYKPGARAAVLAAAIRRQKANESTGSKVTLPIFGDQLVEVKKQLSVLNNLFDRLSKEYEEHIARQVVGPRPFATVHTSMAAMHHEPSALIEGQPPQALLNGNEDDVKKLLDTKTLDPNEPFTNFRCIGKDFATGTPLAIAVLRGHTEMVEMLVDNGSFVNSQYSFIAGAEQMEWSGTAINAAIPSGNLDMVKLLVKLDADINTVGSNGANLVWQAAYFNQTAILEYFIENDVKVDVPATSQDNMKLQYTPLHAAAMQGSSKVVSMLLTARAKHSMDRECRQPLEDAIKNCHADVVKQLLVAKADLFAPVHPESKDELYAESDRCIDLIFNSANPVMLSAVAQGLSQNSCERMNKADFIRFLSGPGEAPCQILESIFQRFAPRYWEEVNGKRFRIFKTAAFVTAHEAVNIMEGPNYRVILNAFNKKSLLPDHTMEFMNQLLPQKATEHQNMYVPVTCYMCHIPMLHKDLQVLLAIADCQNPHIFSIQGCQAIINLAWKMEKRLARFRMMLAFFEVIVLLFINVSVNSGWPLLTPNVVSLIVWGTALVIELLQMIGYASRGLIKRYWSTWRYWFDGLVLLLTGAVNISLMVLGEGVSSHVQFKTAFGILSFLKWMRFLTFLRQFRQIGINILPITATMWDSVPFGLVLSVYFGGAVNMYYALGINNSMFESFLLVYRLVVLGDMGFSEMESVYSPEMVVNMTTGFVTQNSIVSDEYYGAVRLFVIFVSFLMGLTMMNLFVAILCLAYSEAAEEARNSFMQSLTGIVLDQRAVRLGRNALTCQKAKGQDHEEYNSTTLDDDEPIARTAYVWYALQTDKK